MSKKKRKPKIGTNNYSIDGRKISSKAFEASKGESSEHKSLVFSFAYTCPNHFQLSDWQHEELKGLINKLRDFSNMKWSEIRKIKGFKPVDHSTFSQPLPKNISPEVTILEFRTSGRARVFGFRLEETFYIIWFDRNHEVYNMS